MRRSHGPCTVIKQNTYKMGHQNLIKWSNCVRLGALDEKTFGNHLFCYLEITMSRSCDNGLIYLANSEDNEIIHQEKITS